MTNWRAYNLEMGGLLDWLFRQLKLHKGVLAGALLLMAGSGLFSAPASQDGDLQAEFDMRLETAVAATIESFQATFAAIPTNTSLPSATPTHTLVPTHTATLTDTPTATALPFNQGSVGGSGATQGGACDPAYPTVCIPPPPPDLNCGDITFRRFTVLAPDPHSFDRDADGVGCES